MDTVHAQSAAQFDQVGRQFTQTTAELTVQADNQSQLDTGLVRSISLPRWGCREGRGCIAPPQ